MRRAEHEIHETRMPPHHFRERLDDVLDPLPRPEQSKRQQHHAPFHTELRLVNAGVGKRNVRDAVRDHVDLRIGNAINFAQNLRAFPSHHDHAVTAPHQLLHHFALREIRLAENGVQGRHHRHPHFLQERQQMTARRPAIDAELMLHAQHVGIVEVQKIRRAPVGIEILFQQLKADPRRIFVTLHAIIHRPRKTLRVRRRARDAFTKIGRKSRDPTTPRIVPAEESNALRRRRVHVDALSITASSGTAAAGTMVSFPQSFPHFDVRCSARRRRRAERTRWQLSGGRCAGLNIEL